MLGNTTIRQLDKPGILTVVIEDPTDFQILKKNTSGITDVEGTSTIDITNCINPYQLITTNPNL